MDFGSRFLLSVMAIREREREAVTLRQNDKGERERALVSEGEREGAKKQNLRNRDRDAERKTRRPIERLTTRTREKHVLSHLHLNNSEDGNSNVP